MSKEQRKAALAIVLIAFIGVLLIYVAHLFLPTVFVYIVGVAVFFAISVASRMLRSNQQ